MVTKTYNSTSTVGKIEIEEGYVLPIVKKLISSRGEYIGPVGASDGIARHVRNAVWVGISKPRQRYVEIDSTTFLDNQHTFQRMRFAGSITQADVFDETDRIIASGVHVDWLDLDLCVPINKDTVLNLDRAWSHNIDVITFVASARSGRRQNPISPQAVIKRARKFGWNTLYASYRGRGPMHLFVFTKQDVSLGDVLDLTQLSKEERFYVSHLNKGYTTTQLEYKFKYTPHYRCRQTLDKIKKKLYKTNAPDNGGLYE